MKRKVFAIAMSLVLIVALVPLFGGAVFAQDEQGGPGVITEVPAVTGLAISPTLIDFGSLVGGESSTVPEVDRTITLENVGNCDQWISTEITGEERVVEGEKLGHGDGSQTVFGPTDYYPIIEDSKHVYLDGELASGNMYDLDEVNGLVTFVDPPAGGVLVTIDYQSMSTFYSANMTLNDPAAPPEVLTTAYARELVDDCTGLPVAQIYVPEDYPVGTETAQIIFWAEAIVGVTYNLTIAATGPGTTDPSPGPYIYGEGEVVDITAIPDVGAYFVNWVGPVADPNAASTTVTMDADKSVTATFQSEAGPSVTIDAPLAGATVSGTAVSIEASGTDDLGIVSGEYSIDDPTFTSPVAMACTGCPGTPVTLTATWDSTTVADGDHTIYVRAEDTSALKGSDSVAIKVNNLPPVAWTYEVTYVDPSLIGEIGSDTEVTTWNLAVVGVEPITTPYFDGLCARIDTDYGDPPPIRFRAGAMVVLYSSSAWTDVMTGSPIYAEAAINLYGLVITAQITYEWVDADTYIQHTVLDPPLAEATHETHDVVMVGVGPVSVPAGEFVCAEMEDYLVYLYDEAAPPGGPVEPPVLMKTDYLDTATPTTGLIKEIDDSYDGVSTQVLVSVIDPGA